MVLYISSCLIFLLSCSKQKEPSISVIDKSISIEGFSSIYKAGSLTEIKTNTSENIEARHLKLVWINSYGDYILQANPSYNFDIPKFLSIKSGASKILLYYGTYLKQEIDFYISPLKASGTLSTYTGPESLILDQEETTMMVSIPTDIYNNPMEDNYEITFQYKHPKKDASKEKASVKNLFSHIILPSKNISGKLFLAAQAGQSNSKEQEVVIGPGYANNFLIEIKDLHPYADQRQQVKIQTSVLKDGFGNTVTDGTQVNFILTNSDGKKSVFHAYTIFGIASIEIQNPIKPESWVISANVPNAGSSKDLNIKFNASNNQKMLPYYFKEHTLVIGPLKGALSQLITDGTKIQLKTGNQIESQFSENGMVKFDLKKSNIEAEKKFEIFINGNTYNIRR